MRIAATLSTWRRSPLFWILLGAGLLRAAGVFWGLPGADGWDDDGVAPRNFLVGLAQTYTPGAHFTYPPLHMFLLALLSLPGIIIAIASAPSLHPSDVIGTITQVPYMTSFAVVARLVSIAFSLGTIVVVAKMAELVAGRRAGFFAAGALALNAALVYYGVATNLDGPAIFWAALSVYFCMRLIALHEMPAIRWSLLCAAAAIATKDQAYALFVLAFPLGLGSWFATDAWAKANARRLLLSIFLWSIIALLAVLLIDGAITNPHGFADRLAFLTGPASKDYALYEAGPAGWGALLLDMLNGAERYYPAVFLPVALAGVVRVGYRFHLRAEARSAGFLPLLAAVSFTLAFNFVALRNEPRFFLPQSVFLAVYIGIALDGIGLVANGWRLSAIQLLCGIAALLAFSRCAGIASAFLADPRYDAEHWMATHMRSGDAVEIYGLNTYLPRFPAGLRLTRVGPKPLKARNPLPGVSELREPYGAVIRRQPRFLVVPGAWVAVYRDGDSHLAGRGRIVPKVLAASQLDVDARNYFGALFAGQLPYRLAHQSAYAEPLGPRVDAYESLTQPLFIFERKPKKGI
ncbi:MAG: hypothetical protein P4L57_14965 [Rhizomicrobium sp.]|nr:hypothetical protein [Rhizomicrobium sp.]